MNFVLGSEGGGDLAGPLAGLSGGGSVRGVGGPCMRGEGCSNIDDDGGGSGGWRWRWGRRPSEEQRGSFVGACGKGRCGRCTGARWFGDVVLWVELAQDRGGQLGEDARVNLGAGRVEGEGR